MLPEGPMRPGRTLLVVASLACAGQGIVACALPTAEPTPENGDDRAADPSAAGKADCPDTPEDCPYHVFLPAAFNSYCTGSLKVLTYNIASRARWPGGPFLYGHPQAILREVARRIVDEHIDVAGLQEVERGTAAHAGADMVAILRQELAARAPSVVWDVRFARRFDVDGGEFGQVLVSRLPVVAYTAHGLPETAVAQAMRVATTCGDVRVLNYHPLPQYACTSLNTPGGLLDAVSAYADEMTVLLGDFNLQVSGSCYPSLVANHDNACERYTSNPAVDASCQDSVDNAITGTAEPGGYSAIDHVLLRRGAAGTFSRPFAIDWVKADHDANAALVVSDHLPVTARLRY